MTGKDKKKARADETSRGKATRSAPQQAGPSKVNADGKDDEGGEDIVPTNMLSYILQALRLEVFQ
jgi:hypothetical protein